MKINLGKKINIEQFLKIELISLIALLIFLIFFFFSSYVFFNKSITSSNDSFIKPDRNFIYLPDSAPSIKSSPIRLKIKAINVDAKIEYVGLNSIGEMDVPTNLESVAWYSPGTPPGQNGSAVMAGHLNGENGEAGVFKSLDQLKINDEILVENIDGTLNTFIVTKIEYYDYEDDATGVFFSNDGAYLNLITCAGDWDEATKRYAKRLIIFTDIKKNN